MTDNRNMILAIVLSVIVLFGWQFLIAGPQMEQARQAEVAAQQAATETGLATPGQPGAATTAPGAGAAVPVAAGSGQPNALRFETREAAIAASPRLPIETAALTGSINLNGAKLDDLRLKRYRETTNPDSPIVTFLTPAGAPLGYYVEQGFVTAAGAPAIPVDAVWQVEGENTTLTETTPVTLRYDANGLIFRRTFTVDANYMFNIEQSIENTTAGDVALNAFARVVRNDTPLTHNFFILHEGALGVLGSNNLIEIGYSDLQKNQRNDYTATGGWVGFTDKYWAAAVIPDQTRAVQARYSWSASAGRDTYQASYVESTPLLVPAGGTTVDESYVFAGAKVESIIAGYKEQYGIDRLDLLIDWGWFHFITYPMFLLIRFLYSVLGNFGLAILAVTVLVKLAFFPLASRSYASMAAMRRVQPEMKAIQERFKDDRMQQQQAMMELYKKEKINPLSGCWPILIQIPVFFALYKVLFVTIEMRHAPFFGWIQDLAAPDPTNIFTLFGLIPWNPVAIPVIGAFLALGVWPIIMGITMWVQMRLNPPPPDPTQAMIFNWMPVLFTFMLGTFPAGLVIYWAWNNFLSVLQQWFIMRRHGVEVDLFGNIAQSFKRKPKASATKPAE